MPVPPEPVLRAAVRWLQHLPDSGPARCRALFATHRAYSDLTPTQYETAYGWLRAAGLLAGPEPGQSPQRTVFELALTRTTSWFADSDVLIAAPDELPEDARQVARATGLDDQAAFAYMRAAWGKLDTAQRERVGEAGERALLQLLRETLPGTAEVHHVAADADGFGYDIAVRLAGRHAHIEVKATTRRSRLPVYLSRHEYETMRRDAAWQLIAVRLTEHLKPAAVATVPNAWLAAHAPADRGGAGRWESCRFDIPSDVLTPGTSVLREAAGDALPGLLGDTVAWPG